MLSERMRLGGVLALTYIVGRLMARAILYGAWLIDGEWLALAVVVPLAQLAALLVVRRVLWRDAWREGIH
jgi:hypothetical protein